jgi:hypothetical protein
VVEAESLVLICKLYKDFTPLCTKFLINDLKWFPIPKEQTSPLSYVRELYSDAAGFPSRINYGKDRVVVEQVSVKKL